MAWITRQEVRARGFGEPPYSNDRVDEAIAAVENYVEEELGNWFEPRTLTLPLDGSGRDRLLLPFPIISITSITLDGVAIPLDEVVVYNRHLAGIKRPDDRHNPKLVFKSATERTRGTRSWTKGSQNVLIQGDFGYRDYKAGEATGIVPPVLKQALYLLLPRFIEDEGGPYAKEAQVAHNLIESKTRSHHVKYQESHGAITGDPNIDRMLQRMRVPRAGGVV